MRSLIMQKLPIAAALLAALALGACEVPPHETSQNGYRGTGMKQIVNKETAEARRAANVVPEAQPPADPDGPRASEVYQNVQVLGHLSEGEFLRSMTAMTEWVSPEQGCAFCHNLENLADDSPYAKRVSRRMLQMTQHINANWTSHVGDTGVTCYTCHRGEPVPRGIWFTDPGVETRGSAASPMGQNTPARAMAYTSLPRDPLTPLLAQKGEIRVSGAASLAGAPGVTIQDTERTFALMIHMSNGLGVNCTFCHNSRNFADWAQSPPQRVSAWHGINMVRDLNAAYLEPLQSTYPPERLGPLGDAPKAACSTCHQGASKPLGGVSMLRDYLRELSAAPPKP